MQNIRFFNLIVCFRIFLWKCCTVVIILVFKVSAGERRSLLTLGGDTHPQVIIFLAVIVLLLISTALHMHKRRNILKRQMESQTHEDALFEKRNRFFTKLLRVDGVERVYNCRDCFYIFVMFLKF